MPSFKIHTYGCQMNVRDSELLARRLRAAGLEEAPSEDAADVVLVNSCSVREKAEEKADEDTDYSGCYHRYDGSVIEFVIDGLAAEGLIEVLLQLIARLGQARKEPAEETFLLFDRRNIVILLIIVVIFLVFFRFLRGLFLLSEPGERLFLHRF